MSVYQRFDLTISQERHFAPTFSAPIFFCPLSFAQSKETKKCREPLIGDPFLQSPLKLLECVCNSPAGTTPQLRSHKKELMQSVGKNHDWILYLVNRCTRCSLVVAMFLTLGHSAIGQSASATWSTVSASSWAEQARTQGDAMRGASVFFQPSLACATCHVPKNGTIVSTGPDLGHSHAIHPSDRLNDEQLVESILEPSKTIRKGYEASSIRTLDGEVVTGIVVSKHEGAWTLRNANAEYVVVKESEIESSATSMQSLMPIGLMQQFTDRQPFLDLLKYLMEIRDGGPDRARTLQPDLRWMSLKVPEYEAYIDHAGMIQDWSVESLARGAAIYQRVCANCHGTQDQPGSLPTALRFGEGKFKNGSDPYAMYRTLTHGYGFMPAQTWMVPSQKYDVIHYIRETFIAANPHADHRVRTSEDLTREYLAGLPQGNSRGPSPSQIENWSAMDYGNALSHCYEVPGEQLNIAYKGIAMRVDPGPGGVARGSHWMIFDTDTMRWAAGWKSDERTSQQRFIDWRDIQFNGEHGIHPRIVGDIVFANAIGPGWADPKTGSFDDRARVLGRDHRRYGPLPRAWARYRGFYPREGPGAVSYSVGDADILESPALIELGPQSQAAFARVLHIAPHTHGLEFRLADLISPDSEAGIAMASLPLENVPESYLSAVHFGNEIATGIYGEIDGVKLMNRSGRLIVSVPAHDRPRRLLAWTGEPVDESARESVMAKLKESLSALSLDLQPVAKEPTSRWSQTLQTGMNVTFESDSFAIDTLQTPDANPWLAQMRLTGLDFYSDGSLAVCTWDGDVWRVWEQAHDQKFLWKRIASGLYQPLGLKVVEDRVYLTCRDQLAILHPSANDGEVDYVECFNNDHQVTEHFHEFAMGLQRDAEGNFYYAKSGRHALEAVVPQHGTLLRVSADGSRTDILATGFRAANGVCLNPDGSFIVTDQEGFWNPKNRINWVTVDPAMGPKFYGNMYGYHDVTDTSDSAMEPPLCWITNAFDRSPAELLWIDDPYWRELKGGLLNFSYGYGKLYAVLFEEVDGLRQGGMIELPIPSFPTGVMRGRFHPNDHHLYTCGMFSWAGSATEPGGLYRVRKRDEPSHLPIGLHARNDGLHLRFAEPLALDSMQVDRVAIKAWDLKRSERYGSDHLNERALKVTAVERSSDGMSVRIEVEGLAPTWGMEIRYRFRSESGRVVSGRIHNTIHRLSSSAE
jgi:putative heme-binding domain-containing protein